MLDYLHCVWLPDTPEAFWVFIQAVAVSTALWLGLLQLRATTASERLRNARQLMDDYDEQNMSTHIATVRQCGDAVRNVSPTELRDLTAAFKSAAPGERDPAYDALMDVLNQMVILDNYYDEAYDLFHRDVIDRDFFLSRRCDIIEEDLKALIPLLPLAPGIYKNTNQVRIEALAERVKVYKSRSTRLERIRTLSSRLVTEIFQWISGV